MLTAQERKAFLILSLITIAIFISALVLESFGRESFATRFSQETPDGTMVHLTGNIEKQTVVKDGGHTILTVNGTTVFIPGSVASGLTLSPGQSVTIYGLVKTYHGEKEVVVQDTGDIHIH